MIVLWVFTFYNRFDSTDFSIIPPRRPFGVSVALSAEAPAWAAPADWSEKDFEAEIKKLEADAEKRLDAKIAELMGNIEKAGK
jgi:hypothetical protein